LCFMQLAVVLNSKYLISETFNVVINT